MIDVSSIISMPIEQVVDKAEALIYLSQIRDINLLPPELGNMSTINEATIGRLFNDNTLVRLNIVMQQTEKPGSRTDSVTSMKLGYITYNGAPTYIVRVPDYRYPDGYGSMFISDRVEYKQMVNYLWSLFTKEPTGAAIEVDRLFIDSAYGAGVLDWPQTMASNSYHYVDNLASGSELEYFDNAVRRMIMNLNYKQMYYISMLVGY